MRKHHTRKPGRTTVPSRRRKVAGLLAGAAAAGSFVVTQPALTPALPVALAVTASPAPSLPLGRVVLDSAVSGPLWVASGTGAVTSPIGSATFGGIGMPINAPIVAAAPTADAGGYWLAGSDGGVFTFGDARYYGSLGWTHLNQPIVGMAATPDGKGYWLVAADGGVFTFGDAPYYGSLGWTHLNQPVVGMEPTPDGKGYWLVAADGGIFTFGDARYYGSTGGIRLNKPIVAMAATPGGGGYWLLGSDGGIFTFGDAAYHGSLGANPPAAPVRTMVADPAGGYWLATTTGALYPFGATSARSPMIVPSYVPPAPAPPPPPPPPTPAQRAVAFARAQLGKPYLYGGTGPGGYDCSGLSQAAWGAAGVVLPRTAAAQYYSGAHIPVTDAQPGDLLFYSSSGSPSGIYHVGIAMGNGLILHAPHTGTVVQIDAIWAGIYPWATRP
jgi:cell wall-associated NlpC family hydrolase